VSSIGFQYCCELSHHVVTSIGLQNCYELSHHVIILIEVQIFLSFPIKL
jgi:hypothetical protein